MRNLAPPRRRDHGPAGADRRRFDHLYARMYPDADRVECMRATPPYPDLGIDSVVFLPSGSSISFKEVSRQERSHGLLLEVWADYKRDVPGWARDDRLRAEFLAYGMRAADVCFLLRLEQLRRVFESGVQQRWFDDDPLYPRRRHRLDAAGHMCESWSVLVSVARLMHILSLRVERF